jgi:hypothetical protein
MCGLHVVHGFENVEYLFLANTEAFIGIDLTSRILVFN